MGWVGGVSEPKDCVRAYRMLAGACNPMLWPVRVFFQPKDLVNCGTAPAPEMWGCLAGSNYCGVTAAGEYESEAQCKMTKT